MALKYTKVASDAFQKLALNAGILVKEFVPATGAITNIVGATTGGVSFNSNPTFEDFGEDVDNVPANTMQLKRLVSYDPTLSGTFLTLDADTVKELVAGADIDSQDATHIIPRDSLKNSDFEDIWWVGDYSDVNTGANAGYLAIHVMNGLNTSGFQMQSEKDGKSQFAFEYHGHYDLDDITEVPFEIYIKAGTSGSETPSIRLDEHVITIANGAHYTMGYRVVPANATVSWSSAASGQASVSDGVITGASTGNTIITASITDSGVTYSDTCTVIVV